MSIYYKLYGGLGSPYSVKMRALLRYRRIPHVWISTFPEVPNAMQQVKVPVMPILEYPDGHMDNDSTMLIFELDERYPERRVVPESPAMAFLAYLIEDMADEWLTKAMFEYRWRRPLDQEAVSRRLAYDMSPGAGAAEIEAKAQAFKARQVGRMALVGCSEENRPVIEASFEDLLVALEAIVLGSPFLFGAIPSLADFGLYGQLRQLSDDPTPRALMNEQAPLTARWVEQLDDASGVDGAWDEDIGAVTQRLKPLLDIAGQMYLPFLDANARAVATQADMVSATLKGQPFTQPPFKYQVKCLIALRDAYRALNEADAALISPALEAAGAAQYL